MQVLILTNIPDAYTFLNANATSSSGNLWTYDNPDLTINDSGEFKLNALALEQLLNQEIQLIGVLLGEV